MYVLITIMFWRKTRWDQLFGEQYILRYTLPPILETDMDMRPLDRSKEVKALFLWAEEHTQRQLSTDCRGLWGLSQQEHPVQQNNPLRTPSYGSVTPRGGTFYRTPEISGPQPFWHQGPISWRQFLQTGEMLSRWFRHITYIVHFIPIIITSVPSTSDHQALDPRGRLRWQSRGTRSQRHQPRTQRHCI